MTEHLPECEAYRDECGGGCICHHVRACEQRVAEETEAAMIQSFYWKPSPPHDQHYFADNICAYCVGRSEALDAAQEAVDALTAWPEGIESDDLSFLNYLHGVRDALTAINALRKECND